MNRILCIILIFVLSIINYSNAQNKGRYNGLYRFKNNAYSLTNLKDSVKSVYMYYTKVKESLNDKDKYKVVSKSDFSSYEYMEFNKYGLQTSLRQGRGPKRSIDMTNEYQLLNISYYEYDLKDIENKSKYKIGFEQKFPIMNRSLLVKVNENSFSYGSYYDKNGKPAKSLSETIYQYHYDKYGRIKEELEYCPFAEDSIPVKSINKEDLNIRKTFIYNTTNQVVIVKISPGNYGKEMGHYNDFATESPYCQDLQLKYTYDIKGRIIQVIMFGCGKIVAQEDYEYDADKNYVTKLKRFRGGLGSDDYKNTISYYNEFGDIIKKELNHFDPKDDAQEPKYSYYDYDYDKHNNWIRCRSYQEGNHEGEPSVIFEREIEYYNEPNNR